MSYIEKEPLIEFITKGLNNPDKSKAFGYDAIEILTEIEYAPTADVVPSAEVEQLKRNLEQCENGYKQEMHLLQCKLTNATSGAEKQKLEIWRLQGEVERLEKENEKLTINMNAYGLAAKRLAEEKTEIFAEIEEIAKIYTFPVVKNGVVEIAKEPFWCIEPSDLAELKKKHTEGAQEEK